MSKDIRKCFRYSCRGLPQFLLGYFWTVLYMMKLCPNPELTEEKRIFNYHLSRCRRISENAFGILANQWHVFRSHMVSPEKATVIALGAITLHNFLRSKSNIGKVCIPPELADQFDPVTGELTPGI